MKDLPSGFENYNDVMFDIESRFTVKQLKTVCGSLGLQISGTKGILQQRLRSYFDGLLSSKDKLRYTLGRGAVQAERGYDYGSPRIARPNGNTAGTTTAANNAWGMSSLYNNIRTPTYKKLPFYNLLTYVTQSYQVPACPTSRTTQPIQLRLTTEMLAKIQPRQPSNHHRLVLFCTQSDRIHFGNCVVEFPAHAEIRGNGTLVPANLRGIKNKPGTINPPDITPQCILMQGVNNKIDVTFAESRSAYTLTVYLVEKLTVSQLVEKIRKRGFISKEVTLNKMRAAAQDADIVPGAETLTLKDPISMTRINLACKSRYCSHTACFDAATFLTLNEQTPTWICPICNRAISTDDDLFLDGYFQDILQNTNKAVESVIIHPDGTWSNKDIDTDHPDAKLLLNNRSALKEDRKSLDRKVSFGTSRPEIVSLDDDDEEDGVPTPASLPPQSRTVSASVRASPSQVSRKRGPPQVVDLTLSDDEDTPQIVSRPADPPTKRMRVDPPVARVVSSASTDNVTRTSLVSNGISPVSSSIRETHIHSPPSSISPQNDTNIGFQYSQSPSTHPVDYPTTRQIESPKTRPLPSANNREPSSSASPVLPAFQPVQPRPSEQSSVQNLRFDWGSFSGRPSSRTWDSERDDIENEDLDLEMARLPSSMFDADQRRDMDDYEY